VRAQPQRRLDGVGAGRVRHHREAALAADGERRLQLLGQQERVPVPVPGGPHDAAGQVELDVVDAGLDALADGAHEVVAAVAAAGELGAQGVAAGGREEPAAGADARPRQPAVVEGAPERHVDVVGDAGGPDAGDAGLQQPLGRVGRVLERLLGDRGVGDARRFQMNMDVPEARQEPGAGKVDHPRPAGGGRAGAVEDLDDPSLLDGDAGALDDAFAHPVDQAGAGQDESHRDTDGTILGPQTLRRCRPWRASRSTGAWASCC
jgi:hypothetical protein